MSRNLGSRLRCLPSMPLGSPLSLSSGAASSGGSSSSKPSMRVNAAAFSVRQLAQTSGQSWPPAGSLWDGTTAPFKAFPVLNSPEGLKRLRQALAAADKPRLQTSHEWLLPPDEDMPGLRQLARSLAERRALPLKEFLEAVEFFCRVHRPLARATVADLFCGHGLVGVLFALFSPPTTVQQVLLLDAKQPASYTAVLEAAEEAAKQMGLPASYVTGRVRFEKRDLMGPLARLPMSDDAVAAAKEASGGRAAYSSSMARAMLSELEEPDGMTSKPLLPPGASVIGVHACGRRTDMCLEAAIRVCGPVAVMPCCHGPAPGNVPRGVAKALGADLARDVNRSYALQEAGYDVDWNAVPDVVTLKNRMFLGTPKAVRKKTKRAK
eukprot:TRINITY_DN64082_c0_g1_i2.p1 TRINITY_DN64082_c0_g1~~TRINITY_DN64082_c0_g1_i2.p1  ORF type:complete len:398 (-),score=73.75 TRINITY_DN64082_c0_g1_i2:9-1148(-)